MAIQPLHQDPDPSVQSLTSRDRPVLQGTTAEAVDHAEEVRMLRQRVAVLEAALAAANASLIVEAPREQEAPCSTTDTPTPCLHVATSEFSESQTQAVASPEPAAAQEAAVESNHFADAWSNDEESSFEERIAQKAFFQVGSVDEQSRKWLLSN